MIQNHTQSKNSIEPLTPHLLCGNKCLLSVLFTMRTTTNYLNINLESQTMFPPNSFIPLLCKLYVQMQNFKFLKPSLVDIPIQTTIFTRLKYAKETKLSTLRHHSARL